MRVQDSLERKAKKENQIVCLLWHKYLRLLHQAYLGVSPSEPSKYKMVLLRCPNRQSSMDPDLEQGKPTPCMDVEFFQGTKHESQHESVFNTSWQQQ